MPPEQPKYRSRPETTAWMLKLGTHLKRYRVLEVAGLLTMDWRSETAFDLSKCHHNQRHFLEVENEYGVWGTEICVDCGEQVAKECPHVHSTWHLDGQVLICDNCGHDGT